MEEEKTIYCQPAVVRQLKLELESPILAGSVVDNVSAVKTAGQDVVSIDASATDYDFNHSWE